MSVLGVPKAVYKAQQAKKRMSKIQAAGKDGAVGILMNGINEIVDVEVDAEVLLSMAEDSALSADEAKKLAEKLEKQIKEALGQARKNLERELINSTSLEDLKGLLG